MARFSPSNLTFCLLLLLLLTFINVSMAGKEGSLTKAQCPGACSYRCSKTSHKKACMFFCKKCCAKCLCVPSGTYGHKEECPCYNNWKTKRGGPKCP